MLIVSSFCEQRSNSAALWRFRKMFFLITSDIVAYNVKPNEIKSVIINSTRRLIRLMNFDHRSENVIGLYYQQVILDAVKLNFCFKKE